MEHKNTSTEDKWLVGGKVVIETSRKCPICDAPVYPVVKSMSDPLHKYSTVLISCTQGPHHYCVTFMVRGLPDQESANDSKDS